MIEETVLSYREGEWLYLPRCSEDVMATVHYSSEECAETGLSGWCWWAVGEYGSAQSESLAREAAERSLRMQGFL